MDKRKKLVIGAVVAVSVLGLGAAAVATADDQEPAITGGALEKASAAALEHTGGGRVTDTEVGDEEARYEVEVSMEDGTEVDVHLDEDFNVVEVPEDGDDGDGDH